MKGAAVLVALQFVLANSLFLLKLKYKALSWPGSLVLAVIGVLMLRAYLVEQIKYKNGSKGVLVIAIILLVLAVLNLLF